MQSTLPGAILVTVLDLSGFASCSQSVLYPPVDLVVTPPIMQHKKLRGEVFAHPESFLQHLLPLWMRFRLSTLDPLRSYSVHDDEIPLTFGNNASATKVCFSVQ
jgi:hypothetical protein